MRTDECKNDVTAREAIKKINKKCETLFLGGSLFFWCRHFGVGGHEWVILQRWLLSHRDVPAALFRLCAV